MRSIDRNWLRRLLGVSLLCALLFSAARPVWAAPVVTGLQPSTVSNAAGATLVVTGSGFEVNSVVVVDGIGALATTLVTGTVPVLSASLPAGLAPGAYTVRVVNPDGSSAAAPVPLTVVGATATPQPTSYVRPLLVVQHYTASAAAIAPGEDLDFEMTLVNAGQAEASNVVATFASGDFVPRVTGGVRALGAIGPGQTHRFWQPLASSAGLAGKRTATLEVNVTYTDRAGTGYSEDFTLTFPVVQPAAGAVTTSTPTPTPTTRPQLRPQVLISSYAPDVNPLQPGSRFNLDFEVRNVGNAEARQLTMIVGGGSASGGASGTPGPGGVSGGSGEFTNFAPVGSSNVQFLNRLAAGASLKAGVSLIVNSSTNAGAYPLKVSFVYLDERGSYFSDDQVITLLVYQLPVVEISFYRDPGPFFSFQPNIAPVQVVNLGRKAVVLGNMRISAGGAQFSNNQLLVGALEPGGYFPLDAQVIPELAGPLLLEVSVSYTDDFNQSQTITQTLAVEVLEGGPMPGPDGGLPPDGGLNPDGGLPPQEPETFWQKVWRFILGLLGLDSGGPGQGEPVPSGPQEFPPGELPVPGGKG